MSDTIARADTVRPESLAEAREAVVDAGRRRTMLFRGGGTKLHWGRPADPGLIVDTTGLDALLAHNAGDMTAAVGAGMPLERFQAALAEAGQWLAIDPPHVSEGATVGGVYAANDSGPRRHRYGSMRDLVIGITVVLADGAVARAGGQVIKNVAGYDLGKLFCGSLGTLGLVAELTVRLHPLPAAGATLRVPCHAPGAAAFVSELQRSTIEASALDWAAETPGGPGNLWIRIEGARAGVADQTAAVRDRAAARGFDVEHLPDERVEAAWDRLRAAVAGTRGETVARAGTLPDRLPAAARALDEAAAEAGVDATLHSHASLGLHTARFAGGEPGDHTTAVAAWRARVAALGGHVTVRRRRDGVDVAGEDETALDPGAILLQQRVKEQFDPDARCAPGRMIGGI